MGEWRAWFDDNWFTLVQSLGIMGSLWLTALALRREQQSRRLTDYLTLASQHRELWSEAHRRPELARVAKQEVDLVSAPITTAEREFLLLTIVHFNSGWLLARETGMITLDVLALDARTFFKLPLPRAIWDETRGSRDPEFVDFVEDALPRGHRHRLRQHSTTW